jgi:hypothetical protein
MWRRVIAGPIPAIHVCIPGEKEEASRETGK